jgi:hypothetical protein
METNALTGGGGSGNKQPSENKTLVQLTTATAVIQCAE